MIRALADRHLGLEDPLFRTVKPVDEVAAVDQVELLRPADVLLLVAVALVCQQVPEIR
jgi:hypothetical protein